MGGACWPACRVPVGGRAAPTTAWPGGASSRVPAGGRAGSPETPWLYVMVRWGPCAEGCALACWARVRRGRRVRTGGVVAKCLRGGRAWHPARRRRLCWGAQTARTRAIVGQTGPGDGCQGTPVHAGACAPGTAPAGSRALRPARRAGPGLRPVLRTGPGSEQRRAQSQAQAVPGPGSGQRRTLRPAPCAG